MPPPTPRLCGGGLAGVLSAGSDPGGGSDCGLRPAGGELPVARRSEERGGAENRRTHGALHGRLHRSLQLREYQGVGKILNVLFQYQSTHANKGIPTVAVFMTGCMIT